MSAGILDRFRLDGRVAVVTGGTRGIGREIAAALMEAGASVVVVGRDGRRASEAAADLRAFAGGACTARACDLTRPEEAEQLVRETLERLSQIDILVNNAGITLRGPIESLSAQDFRSVQDNNVTTMFNLCRAVAPHMKARRYGRVINMGSILSTVAMAERVPYTVSKGAVLQLTRALAIEWAPHGITVNCLLPAPILTDLNRELLRDRTVERDFVGQIPLGRMGRPDDVAAAAVFLASDAASFITGAGIPVDGGWTAR